jgi:hypothetical protein
LNLYLEFWRWIEVWVGLIIEVSPVNGFDSCLEHLNVILWIRSEHLDEVVIETLEMFHLNFQRVQASLSVVLELVSVDEGILDLGLPHEMHEFVLGINQGGALEVLSVVRLVDEVLVTHVNLFTVHVEFENIILNLIIKAEVFCFIKLR